ncbi:MAG TPA: GxxExxY protein [Clostridia bacterium]|nr:GxxExxY protein [Clostridia bacterium]
MNENQTGTIIVDCAVEWHRNLGPGLLETVYEVTLARAGLTRTINGCLDSEPPCLGASVEKKIHRTWRFTECGSATSVS